MSQICRFVSISAQCDEFQFRDFFLQVGQMQPTQLELHTGGSAKVEGVFGVLRGADEHIRFRGVEQVCPEFALQAETKVAKARIQEMEKHVLAAQGAEKLAARASEDEKTIAKLQACKLLS